MRTRVLFVWRLVSCLYEGSCLVCMRTRVLFVWRLVSCLYEGSCLVCMRTRVLFVLFVFVYVWWCPAHVVLCFCFCFLRLVSPVLPLTRDCPFVIALLLFSDVYFLSKWHELPVMLASCNVSSLVKFRRKKNMMYFVLMSTLIYVNRVL